MANYDYFASYPVVNRRDIDQATQGFSPFDVVESVSSRVRLLSQTILDERLKPYAESGERNHPSGLKSIVLGKSLDREFEKTFKEFIEPFFPSIPVEFNYLPYGSAFIRFPFLLDKPYLSRDDEQFYISENPIKKDKIFKVPVISGSSWKGNMRWVAGKIMESDPQMLTKRTQIVKLFGHENEAQKEYFNSIMPDESKKFSEWAEKTGERKGRLNFYPTFFQQIGLEVINPHNRKTGAGTFPIYFESVPAGAAGIFSLLYLPFDILGYPDLDFVRAEVSKDLHFVFRVLKETMLTYGFSAKKSSGFGIVQETFPTEKGKGVLRAKCKEITTLEYENFTRLEKAIEDVRSKL